jgi:hypothetical protein
MQRDVQQIVEQPEWEPVSLEGAGPETSVNASWPKFLLGRRVGYRALFEVGSGLVPGSLLPNRAFHLSPDVAHFVLFGFLNYLKTFGKIQ